MWKITQLGRKGEKRNKNKTFCSKTTLQDIPLKVILISLKKNLTTVVNHI